MHGCQQTEQVGSWANPLGVWNALVQVLVKKGLGIGTVIGAAGVQLGQQHMEGRRLLPHLQGVPRLVATLVVEFLCVTPPKGVS